MAPALVPTRRSLSGGSQMPASGSTGLFDWTGFIPFEALPQETDPQRGWLATANNKIVGEDYAPFLAARWESPYRADRIAALLEAQPRHDLEGMSAMQMDRLSPAARDLLPVLLEALSRTPPAGDAGTNDAVLRLLRQWDFVTARDRPEPLIFTAWLRELGTAVYADELGPSFERSWFWDAASLQKLLTASDPAQRVWCDDTATPAAEACDEVVAAAFRQALALLAEAYGSDPAAWRWGEAHRATFAHPLLGRIQALRGLFGATIATDGDNFTINRGTPDILPGSPLFPHIHGAGLRMVLDFADLARSRFVIASGQSGNPLSPHYTDFVERWRDGGFVTIVPRDDEARLVLQPE
jgi:penicillin amidase